MKKITPESYQEVCAAILRLAAAHGELIPAYQRVVTLEYDPRMDVVCCWRAGCSEYLESGESPMAALRRLHAEMVDQMPSIAAAMTEAAAAERT